MMYHISRQRLRPLLLFSALLFSPCWFANESRICHMSYVGVVSQEMPREKGDFRAPDLVELVKLDPTIKLDIRYATSNNLLGRPAYKEARAFLQRPAAEALARANHKL